MNELVLSKCYEPQVILLHIAKLKIESQELHLQSDLSQSLRHSEIMEIHLEVLKCQYRLLELKFSGNNCWIPYTAENIEPFSGILVLGYSPKWVHEDYCPNGIREISLCDAGLYVARWNGSHDEWITELQDVEGDGSDMPTYFIRQPKPPKHV